LNKNNSILLSEKVLLEKELNLCDKNNEDLRTKINILESDIDKTLNAKESEKLSNHGLKQTLIDINGKNDILEREIKKYKGDMTDLSNENVHLNDTFGDVKNKLTSTDKNVDDLRMLNASSNDELKSKVEELEGMKQNASDMALNFENELVLLNKS